MRRYLRWLLGAAAACIAFVGVFNFLVDPYDVSGRNLLHLSQEEMSKFRNDRLYEIARFNRDPRDIIVLGDSRGRGLKEQYFAAKGLDVRNLSYGGGTVYESIDTFWFAVRRTNVKMVVLVVPFNSWSESDPGDLVKNAVGLVDYPATYYLNTGIFRASFANLLANLRGHVHATQAPPMSESAFWRYQLDYSARAYYERWQKPKKLRGLFLALTEECRRLGIRLLLVVPPTHVDLQELIPRYHLEAEHARYLAFLHAAAETLDFDVIDATTTDRTKFEDPFHAVPEVNREIVGQIVERLRSKTVPAVAAPIPAASPPQRHISLRHSRTPGFPSR